MIDTENAIMIGVLVNTAIQFVWFYHSAEGDKFFSRRRRTTRRRKR